MNRPHHDDGMTLIELLVSVGVMMLIVGPIVLALQFGLASAVAGSQRTTDSAGAQLLTSYLPTDVQSANFLWTPDSPTSFSTPYIHRCGDNDTRLEVQSRNATTGSVQAVTYDLRPTSTPASDTALSRRTWSADSSPCTLIDSSTLLAAVDAGDAPSATCVPASCAAAHTVVFEVDAFSSSVHNTSLYDTYSFEVTGSRRTE